MNKSQPTIQEVEKYIKKGIIGAMNAYDNRKNKEDEIASSSVLFALENILNFINKSDDE